MAPALELGTRIRDKRFVLTVFRAGVIGSKDAVQGGALARSAFFVSHALLGVESWFVKYAIAFRKSCIDSDLGRVFCARTGSAARFGLTS